MLALEFAWAERLLERIVDRLEQAGERAARATPLQKALVGVAILLAVAALIVAAFLWDLPVVPL
jgi:hypothetical protein